jgi:hypothetical protein
LLIAFLNAVTAALNRLTSAAIGAASILTSIMFP